ncbi:MAG: peptidylprolyl isomerase [Methylophilales bacterium]|nr:peptidylprolyl isomerase [Methylophilales bacterium]
MMRLFALVLLFCCANALAANPQVEFETSRGNFVLELYPEKAPRSVENFLRYVNADFYTGTVFHRTIKNFVVQGGGLTESLEAKSTWSPIANESNNGLSNDMGTVAMARGYAPDSATSQFFVNLTDNRFLNYYKSEAGLEGYTVFGRVVKGYELLQRISESSTTTVAKLKDVPKEFVVIRAARVLDMPVTAESLPMPELPKAKSSKTKAASKKKSKKSQPTSKL